MLVLTQAAMFLARPVTSYRALALGRRARHRPHRRSLAVLPLLVAVPLGRVADRRRPVGMLAGGAAVLVVSHVWSAAVSLGQLIGPAVGGLVLSAGPAGSMAEATTRAFLVAAGLGALALSASSERAPREPGAAASGGSADR